MITRTLATSVISLNLLLTTGCDVDDPESRALAVAALADEDLDPEIRAQLAAELDEDDGELPGTVDGLRDDGAVEGPTTCFFCPQPQPISPTTYVPVVINPYAQPNAQSNIILYMAAASSFITLPGATVVLKDPNSASTFGPYALSYDVSGTQIRANVTGAFPNNTCRIITVTNPNNKVSSPVQACR